MSGQQTFDTGFADVKLPGDIPEGSTARSPFRVDEGYSEDPRSQNDSDNERGFEPDTVPMDTLESDSAHIATTREWLLAQPPEMRTAIARDILQSLPNAIVSELVREANQRLHFDPVECLPHEIITSILNYLPWSSVNNASLVSKSWRQRAVDPWLWRRLFQYEGWTYSLDQIRTAEQEAKNNGSKNGKVRACNASAEESANKKARSGQGPRSMALSDPFTPGPDGSLDLPDMWLDSSVVGQPQQRGVSAGRAHFDNQMDTEMPDLLPAPKSDDDKTRSEGSLSPWVDANQKLLIPDPKSNDPISNWRHLFIQRQRLERNWLAGRYTNFRLPRIGHASDAHTQCVYTIQYSGNHLVSGSRDKTVRVWDLETGRLRLKPLEGHEGSVLCLQFDERPDQDVIISGGSDADVIIWKFSTGDMIKRMKRAHSESVLNLRFDHRYLVTCSKDKTIRVWSRKQLQPGDEDYPDRGQSGNAQYPEYIINPQDYESIPNELSSHSIQPYQLLMTFEGHGAAVNAIQIFGHEIVSASGDRKIMLWNIKNGELVRGYNGHSKGIACVQYDGRRIVSGSSDNTVRIFDSSTSAEVATLEGHQNLVRTVQAEFGDAGRDWMLEDEARQNDASILEDRRRHMLDGCEPSESSDKPFVLGAKLPPGGGGSPWSKIVSGSYDETVMIWRHDKQGRWSIAKELRQEDALRVASGLPLRQRRSLPRFRQARLPAGHVAQAQNQQLHQHLQQAYQNHLLQNQHAFSNGQQQNLNGGNAPPAAASPSPLGSPSLGQQTNHHNPQPEQQSNQPQGHVQQHNQPQAQHNVAGLQGVQGSTPPNNNPQVQNMNPAAAAAMAAQVGAAGPNNRVFKLQFDSRRIVCCSQDPVIVGWDFSNGDREIMEASRFFGEPR